MTLYDCMTEMNKTTSEIHAARGEIGLDIEASELDGDSVVAMVDAYTPAHAETSSAGDSGGVDNVIPQQRRKEVSGSGAPESQSKVEGKGKCVDNDMVNRRRYARTQDHPLVQVRM